MSLFRRGRVQRDLFGIEGAGDLIPGRTSRKVGNYVVTDASAMRHSAVWACIRLRSDLMSTFPVKVYRDVGDIAVLMSKPPVLEMPGGPRVRMIEWLASSQKDLDRCGNSIGLIRERNALNLPARIELQPSSVCSVRERKGKLTYWIDGKSYDPEHVWHEKQHTESGLPVGLSPVSHAALSIGQYMSVQEFASAWYSGGGVPRARLKNNARVVPEPEAIAIKARWKNAMTDGDLFVHGMDWEYDLIQAQKADSAWLEAQRFSATDIARFFGCPGDLIDAAVSGQSITYANITERNLQFLIMHLGPAVIRREDALSQLLPRPRYVKLNTDALLRMDPKSRADMFAVQIGSRQIAVSEARELENRRPYTAAQLREFTELFGTPSAGEPAEAPGAEDAPEAPGFGEDLEEVTP